jgi:hypothetical protein
MPKKSEALFLSHPPPHIRLDAHRAPLQNTSASPQSPRVSPLISIIDFPIFFP